MKSSSNRGSHHRTDPRSRVESDHAKGRTQLLGTMGGVAISAQTQARIYLIRLPDVEVVETEAVAEAKANRLDLQNRLAHVTDAWRKVAVAANQLQADFNLIANVKPAAGPRRRTPARLLQGPEPATASDCSSTARSTASRNEHQYRLSLISYQRPRRAYMDSPDRIEQQIRTDIRWRLRRERPASEIARRSLIAAARQLGERSSFCSRPRTRPPGGNARRCYPADAPRP